MGEVTALNGGAFERRIVALRVLSTFELRCDGRVVELPGQAERVLTLLALHDGRDQRITVASTLWPDTTERRASANLRTALWKLGQSVPHVLRTSRTHLALADDVEVDLAALVGQAQRLIRGDDLRDDDLDTAWLTADLLVDRDEEWLVPMRERLRQLRLHALEALSARLSLAGRHAEAVEAACLAVAAEPLRESAQRALIAAHLGEGNVAEALTAYDAYRRLLWNELGLRPSAALDQLLQRQRRPEPVVASA